MDYEGVSAVGADLDDRHEEEVEVGADYEEDRTEEGQHQVDVAAHSSEVNVCISESQDLTRVSVIPANPAEFLRAVHGLRV